jgi:uncharacterized protein YdhG (YjbR/CyaY superfamily)
VHLVSLRNEAYTNSMSYQQSPLVTDYIDHFNGETKQRLEALRKAVQSAFPKTIEDISYGMPTYRPAPKKRGVVHFAASKGHIGLYAIFDPKNNSTMHEKMKPYRTGRGTLQFQNDQPFPLKTIREILAYQEGYLLEHELYQ